MHLELTPGDGLLPGSLFPGWTQVSDLEPHDIKPVVLQCPLQYSNSVSICMRHRPAYFTQPFLKKIWVFCYSLKPMVLMWIKLIVTSSNDFLCVCVCVFLCIVGALKTILSEVLVYNICKRRATVMSLGPVPHFHRVLGFED